MFWGIMKKKLSPFCKVWCQRGGLYYVTDKSLASERIKQLKLTCFNCFMA